MYNISTMDLQQGLTFEGLTARTIRGIYGTLKTALRQAMAWGLLGYDPTVGLRAPRVPRKKRRVLSLEGITALLEAAKPYKYYLVIRILALTGMRLGEALGLRWQDIDFKKGILTIQGGGRRALPDAKTD
ncbi:MAG: tyrosine-type recombinase/integrase [Desulfotomaculaceae bacterium]|nr:tyrosine-type recombinase/integrase [Desulfotomaculaceae bacterium]